ncbi:hypothetical protein STCU_12031 [Strigomonas culicis]|uniref:Uncharacterized protein n=1 Tax=Strigomonas culicis TaxID=28005 RepID=S9UY06_9TRYP|nr:hypothetical protein STCU_12031 [Strigomonas culicis]|eukprot:EPY15430.1 hypothetical protein STCU_12031 [Strigomonas culicis]
MNISTGKEKKRLFYSPLYNSFAFDPFAACTDDTEDQCNTCAEGYTVSASICVAETTNEDFSRSDKPRQRSGRQTARRGRNNHRGGLVFEDVKTDAMYNTDSEVNE